MAWIHRYKTGHYVRNSVWLLPVLGMVAALVLVRILHWLEVQAGWQSKFETSAALAVFSSLAGSMFTFVVFLSSSLLLVVQIASSQLSPRIVGVVLQNPLPRFSLALFTFTFTFTLGVLLRIQDSVPALTGYVAVYLCILSIGVFMFLIDHVGKSLRPGGALLTVGRLGQEVIKRVYPRLLTEPTALAENPVTLPEGKPVRTDLSPNDGVLLAFDPVGLAALARAAGCVVELVPQVGDFVAAGSPLFRTFGGQSGPTAEALWQSVALGSERTLEQDPAFAFRIIVDIASKGLSPAINDPTTAVLAIDQIHHLLRSVGHRHLDEGTVCDPSGALRLVYPTPNWEDFVSLAVTEIRQFGGTSIQVARRLRRMLENLAEVLPPGRAKLLCRELKLLECSTARFFHDAEDRALADVSDSQGVGGKRPEAKPGVEDPVP